MTGCAKKSMTIMLAVIAVVIYQFRCPPLSQMLSEVYFQEESNSKDSYYSEPLEISGTTTTYSICASIPACTPIYVYRAQLSESTVELLVYKLLCLTDDLVVENVSDVMMGFFAGTGYLLHASACNGYYGTEGTVSLNISTDNRERFLATIGTALKESGYQEDAIIDSMQNCNGYVFSPKSFPYKLLNVSSVDNRRGVVYPPACINAMEHEYGVELYGTCLSKFEVINEFPALIAFDDVLRALDNYLRKQQVTIPVSLNYVSLSYQAKYVRGKPNERILIPVWVIANTLDMEVAYMVDALSGDVSEVRGIAL